jgi:hypothetical protein
MTIRIDNFPVLYDFVCTEEEILHSCSVLFACAYTNENFARLHPSPCVKQFLHVKV